MSTPHRARHAAPAVVSQPEARSAWPDPAEAGTVQFSAVQFGAEQHGAAEHAAGPRGTGRHGAGRHTAGGPGAEPARPAALPAQPVPAQPVAAPAVPAKPVAAPAVPAAAAVPTAPAASARSRRAGGGAGQLRLIWVYPDLLSTYGDRGNLLVLERRARLRGIEVSSAEVNSDQSVPQQGDIYLMGGGEDLPQILAARRLRADGGLAAAADRGAVLFSVCAGYQVLGEQFGGVDGEPVPGLGILDISSGRGERRGVGEIVADADPELGIPRLTGFENHQGVTRLGPGARPVARVTLGTGNGDGTEGAYAGQVLGTYLHGPALVRNPGLADLLLTWAAGPLSPLDQADEDWARQLRDERLAAATAPAH
jgi:CobQ-like glutamine amidotransferase family enzyme